MNDPSNRAEALDAKIEAMARRIAPADFGGHPVYVLRSSELPQRHRPPSYLWGLTGPVLDLSVKSWLTSQGRWFGRGPAVILNDEAIRRDTTKLAGDDPAFADELYLVRLLATGLHELAHILTRKLDLTVPPVEIEAEVMETAEAALSDFGQVTEAEADEPSDLPPWTGGHDAGFVRALVHVLDRAEKTSGQRIPTSLAFPSQRYELSLLEHYRRALAPEIAAFDSSLCFADLRSCDPPKAFCELWRDDCRRWWKSTRDQDTTLGFYIEALRPYVRVLTAD